MAGANVWAENCKGLALNLKLKENDIKVHNI